MSGNGNKYPYNPFYGSFSPRVGLAWNPHFAGDGLGSKIFGHEATVIRGGYGRVYGRLNGVDLVLVPLLGVGLIQPVQCTQALASGACGPANPTASTAFRIGVDGNTAPLAAASPTLPQPVLSGLQQCRSLGGRGPRSELPAQRLRYVRSDHPAPDKPSKHVGGWLYRAPDPP